MKYKTTALFMMTFLSMSFAQGNELRKSNMYITLTYLNTNMSQSVEVARLGAAVHIVKNYGEKTGLIQSCQVQRVAFQTQISCQIPNVPLKLGDSVIRVKTENLISELARSTSNNGNSRAAFAVLRREGTVCSFDRFATAYAYKDSLKGETSIEINSLDGYMAKRFGPENWAQLVTCSHPNNPFEIVKMQIVTTPSEAVN